jgi:hypothetical protein
LFDDEPDCPHVRPEDVPTNSLAELMTSLDGKLILLKQVKVHALERKRNLQKRLEKKQEAIIWRMLLIARLEMFTKLEG